MVKLHYTYRDAPISAYRARGKSGPGKGTTIVIIAILVCGLIFGAWKIYSSDQEDESDTAAIATVETTTQISGGEPVNVSAPTQEPRKVEIVVTTQPSGEMSEKQAAWDRAVRQLIETGRYEDARARLQSCLETLPANHSYFGRAQNLLAVCTQNLLQRNDFRQNYIEYAIKSGDTLGKIAGKFNTNVRAICKMTNLTNPNRLKIGQILRIPQNCWTGKITKEQQKLFIYHTNRLVLVFSINGKKLAGKGPFKFDANDTSFREACGMNDADWDTLVKIFPNGSPIQSE